VEDLESASGATGERLGLAAPFGFTAPPGDGVRRPHGGCIFLSDGRGLTLRACLRRSRQHQAGDGLATRLECFQLGMFLLASSACSVVSAAARDRLCARPAAAASRSWPTDVKRGAALAGALIGCWALHGQQRLAGLGGLRQKRSNSSGLLGLALYRAKLRARREVVALDTGWHGPDDPHRPGPAFWGWSGTLSKPRWGLIIGTFKAGSTHGSAGGPVRLRPISPRPGGALAWGHSPGRPLMQPRQWAAPSAPARGQLPGGSPGDHIRQMPGGPW